MNGWAWAAIGLTAWFLIAAAAGFPIARLIHHGSRILEDIDRGHEG